MMRGTTTAKITALTLAICVHGAVALSLAAKEDIQAEGADGGTDVRLGTAFADMVAGPLTAARPVTPEAAQTDTSEPIQAERPTTAQVPTVPAPQSAAVTRSLRPMQRSAAFESAHKPTQAAKSSPSPKPEMRQAAPTPRNPKRNARARAATCKPDAAPRQSGTGGRQKTTGNAAASNYPGLVMRRLSRAGKPRADARGSAFVAFSISANGGLAAVSLARSSDSSALDQAAL